MAHHGNIPSENRNFPVDPKLDYLMKKLARDQDLGATKQFPQGQLNEHDEGEIRLMIGHEKGKVILNFGTQITWVGFDPEQAKQLAQSILEHAEACK